MQRLDTDVGYMREPTCRSIGSPIVHVARSLRGSYSNIAPQGEFQPLIRAHPQTAWITSPRPTSGTLLTPHPLEEGGKRSRLAGLVALVTSRGDVVTVF